MSTNTNPTAKEVAAAQAICDLRNSLTGPLASLAPQYLEMMRACEAALMGNDSKAKIILAGILDS